MDKEKHKSTRELAQEIVNAWNNKLDNETDEEFEERMSSSRSEYHSSPLSLREVPYPRRTLWQVRSSHYVEPR